MQVGKSVAYAIGCREDRDENLWIAASSGLFRLQQGQVTKLVRESGLSGDFASDVFEDRDGNLWVGTRGGLDRLQDGPVRTFTAKEGLLGDSGPILIGQQGAVWTASGQQVSRIADKELATWRLALPAKGQPVSMLSQPGSEFLIGFGAGVARWHLQRVEMIQALAGLDVRCMLQARNGSIWIGSANRGLVRWNPSERSAASLETIIRDNSIVTLAEDSKGALWAGSLFGGGLYRFDNGQVQNFGPADGLKSPVVYTVFADENDGVWIGSLAGLSWFQDGRLRTAGSQEGLPSNQVLAIVDDSYGRLWFTTFAGIASIEKRSLIDWAEGRRARLTPTVYRGTDRMQIYTVGRTFPNAVRSHDGNLWFSFGDGVAEVIPPDPRFSQELQFPVAIEGVTTDGIQHSGGGRLRIPAGTRSVQITYTAIALTNPESVRFRYRLQGLDKDWVQAESRRTAFYNNLGPGTYTFIVSASSGGTQWKAARALVLEQVPFFYQTMWFTLLVATAVVSVAAFVYRLRVQQAIDRIQAGFQERMDERTRIAQELHDTVVQAISGLTMLVENAAERAPDSLPIVKGTLMRAVDKLDFALAESRAALKGLRETAKTENDLAKQLAMVANSANDQKVTFTLATVGELREIRPVVRYEVFRIGSEVITNAFKHAEATRIGVELDHANGLRLSVQDNGKGIPAEILNQGKEDHFGLQGIRERADRIGAQVTIYSRAGEGTQIELTVPENVAFDSPQRNQSLLDRSLSKLRRLSANRL